ncbi:MAG TPA: MAPEG family protein [Xanthomonadaceae bacterium]|nr:MAPEG family protein [Xanthomonadaceae bacterium]
MVVVAFPATAAIYCALSVVLVIGLALRVVQIRRSHQIGIGDNGHADLARRIRVHANALENLPLALLLLVLLDMSGVAAPWIHGFGAGLLLARLAHAGGLSRRSGYSHGRFHGTLVTWLLMLVMAAWLLLRSI